MSLSLSRRITFLLICSLFSSVRLSAQDDLDLVKEAGDNIGRTEEGDELPESEINDQLGKLGPIEFPVTFEQAGNATLALYSPEGQLVRILAQVIPVEPREYRVRWDGLDLFGNAVPAGTELRLKTFFSPGGLKATYEMSVAAPKVAPWPGDFSKDGQQRAGGWMGDHSAPSSIAAVGDRLLIGYSLAEAGYNIAALTTEGEMIWGDKLEGWDGSSTMNAAAEDVAVINRRGNKVYRISPYTEEERGRHKMKKTLVLEGSGFQQLAVHGDKLLVIAKNEALARNPFPKAFGGGDIDYTRSRPQVLNTTAATEFVVSPQAAFGQTFTRAGNPQSGFAMIPHEGQALVLLVFKKPVQVGSVLLPRMDGVKKFEVLTLKSGLPYQEAYSPLAHKDSVDPLAMTLGDQGVEWVPFGQSEVKETLNWVTAKGEPVETAAVLLRALPEDGGERNWKPRLNMARMFAEKLVAVPVSGVGLHSDTRLQREGLDFGTATGWKARTEYPISAVYPMSMQLRFPDEKTFNALGLLNATHPELEVDVLKTGVGPARASEEDWVPAGKIRGSFEKKLGHLTASRKSYERLFQLDQTVRTRGLRFRMNSGYQGGKWGDSQDDSFLSEVEHIELLMNLNPDAIGETPPSHTLHLANFVSGKALGSWQDSAYAMQAIDYAPDGVLYTLAEGQLRKSVLNPATGRFRHEPLAAPEFDTKGRLVMDVNASRVFVADEVRKLAVVMDRQGKVLHRIGTGKYRQPGPWDPYVVHNPKGVALASNGDLWLAEGSFAPKRIAQFSSDGRFKHEYLGPPMYGGGGYLDQDLKHFFYRGMEYELDWEKGISRLKNHNDTAYHPNTPDPGASTFTFTSIGKPVYHEGRRYLHNGLTYVRKPDDAAAWLPAMVAGYAHENPFLMRKEVWNKHWGKLNLSDLFFVWNDLNGDGAYQVEEVETISKDRLPRMGGGAPGPGLALWGKTFRWAPRSFTDQGVPVFKLEDIKPFDYDTLAPHYRQNYTLAGPRSAKPGYGGYHYVDGDGYLAQEGQPFVVKPDGSLLGGTSPKPSADYIPPIIGNVVQTAWAWSGGADTASDVGEIAVIHSYAGPWHVWSVKHGVMLDRFFTGEEGGWNGLPLQRGMDVTRRGFGWEGWYGNFVKGLDGNYYAQGGKTFHSISRIHGIDDIVLRESTHTVSPEQARLAATLRPVLVGRSTANSRQEVIAEPVDTRLRHYKLDGFLDDWGDRGRFAFMDQKERSTRFDVSHNDEGILLAIDGRGKVEGDVQDWRQAHHQGFAIDIQIRGTSNGRAQRSGSILPGDKRIVLIRQQGKWVAVLYQPVLENGASPHPLKLNSPNLDLFLDEVRLLEASEIRFAVQEKSLDVNLLDLGGGATDAFGLEDGLMLDSEKSGGEIKRGGGGDWSAEILLPWSLVGEGIGPRRFDVGIREADARGRRFYWNNAYPGPSTDPVLQGYLNPSAWGRLLISKE